MALENANIFTTLVGNTLGTSSRDVGTLCSHPNINMWSKHKPVRYPKTTGLTEAEFVSIDGDYGIKFTKGSYDVSYKAPIGTSASPFRLGDFRGYNHNAMPPTYAVFPNSPINSLVTQQIIIYTYSATTIETEVPLYDLALPETITTEQGDTVGFAGVLRIGCDVIKDGAVLKSYKTNHFLNTGGAITVDCSGFSGSYTFRLFTYGNMLLTDKWPFPGNVNYPNVKTIAFNRDPIMMGLITGGSLGGRWLDELGMNDVVNANGIDPANLAVDIKTTSYTVDLDISKLNLEVSTTVDGGGQLIRHTDTFATVRPMGTVPSEVIVSGNIYKIPPSTTVRFSVVRRVDWMTSGAPPFILDGWILHYALKYGTETLSTISYACRNV